MRHKRTGAIALWLAVVIIAVTAIYFGNRYATDNLVLFGGSDNQTIKAKVRSVGETITATESIYGSEKIELKSTSFVCEVQGGTQDGKHLEAVQRLSEMYAGGDRVKPVAVGDKVLLSNVQGASGQLEWQFIDYYRFDKMIILLTAFALLLILLGKIKGLNTIISLAFTFLFVFLVFVPWVMSGHNVYLGVFATCLFTVVITLLLVCGASRKSLVTALGCLLGVGVAALITFCLNRFLCLTGFIDEHSIYLTKISPDKPIDLVALVFAAIIIGALGAIMDVAMDISSALYELCEHVPTITFGALFKSGMRIGSDIMGTMANTLILAYIGSSLCSIILLFTYSSSLMQFLNREVVIIEILQGLTGGIAILLTVPITVSISGLLYIRKQKSTAMARRID